MDPHTGHQMSQGAEKSQPPEVGIESSREICSRDRYITHFYCLAVEAGFHRKAVEGGHENILVITDHFTRYAQAIPTKNQSANTTAKALFENFFVHYGFPSKIHSDMGANFESKVIRKLCDIADIKKTRTTPYHPMGNGMVERFNKTLLNMMATLQEVNKTDWKAHVSTLTHAYNAAVHDSTGFAPYYLMFGRHPRLAIDAFLGLPSNNPIAKSKQDYSDKLKEQLHTAYD